MEQRQLRLGDILDDYCPRERRITNHAVVAMLDDKVQQTRCTTCDAEHEYKAARVPPRRKKKETPAVLYEEVLAARDKPAAVPGPSETPPADASPRPVLAPRAAQPVPRAMPTVAPPAPTVQAAPSVPPENEEAEPSPAEDGPVHRPLIRATLPRPEGQAPARPAPDFTVRQSGGRGGFRDEQRGGTRNWIGNSSNGNGNRAGAPRPQRSRMAKAARGGRPPFGNQPGPRSLDRSQSPGRPRPGQAGRTGKKRSR
jgi:hypothetical protein